MWFVDWFGDLVFGNESFFAFNPDYRRKMRPERKESAGGTAKHIISREPRHRSMAATAKDR